MTYESDKWLGRFFIFSSFKSYCFAVRQSIIKGKRIYLHTVFYVKDLSLF